MRLDGQGALLREGTIELRPEVPKKVSQEKIWLKPFLGR